MKDLKVFEENAKLAKQIEDQFTNNQENLN
jgi:hypothetical protein